MKNILRISFSISFAAMAMLLLPGCKKFLEREPLGRYTLDDLGASSIESQVFAMYAGLRTEGMSGIKFIAVHSIRSDDADKGSIPSDNLAAETFFDEFNYTKDFWLLNDYWGDHYRLIKLTNDVIDAVEKLDNPNAAEIVNRAEAKFLRAYAYFNLVRAFGQVPKIDFLVENVEDGNKPKATVDEIYVLICRKPLPTCRHPGNLGLLAEPPNGPQKLYRRKPSSHGATGPAHSQPRKR